MIMRLREGEKVRLDGVVALVTGASRGIGEAAAEAFARAGAHVALAARDAGALGMVAERLRAYGVEALPVPTDVGDPESVATLHARIMEHFGRLDAAFNNAAGDRRPPTPLAEVAVDDFDAACRVNLRGTFLCMKAEIPLMLRGGGGVVVNMASTAGVRGHAGLAAYAATKHAIVALSEVAALDYGARGVRVNVIAPGTIETHRVGRMPQDIRHQMQSGIPLARFGTPAEVANAVVWLCSEHASYVSGATLVIDGGRIAGGA
jgi:NAD(P)-dependent dehydrogenase (short-subunit alcohol dehydrogenase family)